MKTKIIIGILLVIFLSGCFGETKSEDGEFPSQEYCMEHITELSCDELLLCYDECNNVMWLGWMGECRDGYKARLWKCYGAINE